MTQEMPLASNLNLIPKAPQLSLEISQYPILAKRIREQMRAELFSRGVIRPEAFEQEVRAKAIRSQELEGLSNPFEQEPADVWQTRMEKIRDDLTDFYFAFNLPHDLFRDIVQRLIGQRAPTPEGTLTLKPEPHA